MEVSQRLEFGEKTDRRSGGDAAQHQPAAEIALTVEHVGGRLRQGEIPLHDGTYRYASRRGDRSRVGFAGCTVLAKPTRRVRGYVRSKALCQHKVGMLHTLRATHVTHVTHVTSTTHVHT